MNRDIDVSGLPTYGYGSRALTWWGTGGMILIEGVVFLGAIATYLYLRTRTDLWPPVGNPPDLFWGTLNLAVLAFSAVANQWTKGQAEREDLRGTRIGFVLVTGFGLLLLGIRILEFQHLNTTYSGSAYGSITFALLTLHTAHLLTDFIDTAVLAVLMFRGPLEGRRFVDASENCLYWWFVVASWVPVYLTVYVAPRLL